MNERVLALVERIRDEFVSLEIVRERALRGWHKYRSAPSEDAFLDSTVLNLHGFYNGLEILFEMIAEVVDDHLPRGAEWHKTLLTQMAAEMPSRRPPVISSQTLLALDKYRGFRHVVRHVYTFNFEPTQVQQLVDMLPSCYTQVQAELFAFADFLEQRAAAAADES